MDKTFSIRSILKIAGAFVAWVIGSGFATGQEVLQFFTAYGRMSFAIIAMNMLGFVVIGYLIMRSGFENKAVVGFNHFRYFCGGGVGTFYTWLQRVVLLMVMPVLVAGAGATLNEHYGIPQFIGSALMTLLVLLAYLSGFERMIKLISSLGPSIIVFSLLVGTVTLLKDFGKASEVSSYEAVLAPFQAAPHWGLSALLYLGLNFFPGSTYFVQLGTTASSKKELKYGALIGGGGLVLSIALVSTAILLNGDVVAGVQIPVLYLALRISSVLATLFSVVLVFGIFSSCSVMMWSLCSRFSFRKKFWNVLAAIGVAVFAYVVSLLSFGTLISTIYPLIGYIGLVFISAVLLRRRANGTSNFSDGPKHPSV